MVALAPDPNIRFVMNRRATAVHVVRASDAGPSTAPVVACCGQKLRPGTEDQEYVECFHDGALCGNCYRDLREGEAQLVLQRAQAGGER